MLWQSFLTDVYLRTCSQSQPSQLVVCGQACQTFTTAMTNSLPFRFSLLLMLATIVSATPAAQISATTYGQEALSALPGDIDLIFQRENWHYIVNTNLLLVLSDEEDAATVYVAYRARINFPDLELAGVDTYWNDSMESSKCMKTASQISCSIGDPYSLSPGTHSFRVVLFLRNKMTGHTFIAAEQTKYITVVPRIPVAPGRLVMVNAGLTGASPSLYWGASSSTGVSYNVYRCFSSNETCSSSGTVIATTTATNYTDAWVTITTESDAAGSYTYWVKATKLGAESEPTNAVSTWGTPSFFYLAAQERGDPTMATLQTDTTIPGIDGLYQNYPNPFNSATKIRFDLPEASQVTLIVYDILGREVDRLLDRHLSAGSHSVTWNAGALPGGLYMYHLKAGVYSETRQMTLAK